MEYSSNYFGMFSHKLLGFARTHIMVLGLQVITLYNHTDYSQLNIINWSDGYLYAS